MKRKAPRTATSGLLRDFPDSKDVESGLELFSDSNDENSTVVAVVS
jgi:hypothetical protein